MKKILLPLLFTLYTLCADELTHTLSYQGFTGVINTPNAQVMNHGDLTFHYDNQFDNVLRSYNYNKPQTDNDNFIFGAGLFSSFEVQGRLSETPKYQRDLSANIKFKLPYTHKYLPNLAIGIQDLGSASNYYGNKYIVIDKKFWRIRASVGYGKSDGLVKNKKRMNGLFYSTEVKAFNWIYLLAEDDTKEKFIGIRIELPKQYTEYFKLNTLITRNLSDKKISAGINLTFPLYENRDTYYPNTIYKYQQELHEKVTQKEQKLRGEVKSSLGELKKENDKKLDISKLKKTLIKLGIENITIATKGKTIYIAYENGVFLFNDIDALGVVIGLLSETKYTHFIVAEKRSNIVVFTLVGDIKSAKDFFNNPSPLTKIKFANGLKKISPIDLNTYDIIVKGANNSKMKVDVELSPHIVSFIGNEFGVFNYKLWLRTKALINVEKGVDFSVVGDIHIHDSKIDNHRYDWFMKLYERKSHIESIMINNSKNIYGGINTLSLGTLEENYIGAVNQYIYNYDNHTFSAKVGYLQEFKNGDPYKEKYYGRVEKRTFYIGTYSYLLSDYDVQLQLKFGKYWNQDIGYEAKIKSFFGDVAVYLDYKENRSAALLFSEQTNRVAGFGVEIPLTLRHTPNFSMGQIRGTKAFNYEVKTTILRGDGTNNIVSGGNIDPEIAISSENYFYNRNRVQLSYMKSHLFRMKESFDIYVK